MSDTFATREHLIDVALHLIEAGHYGAAHKYLSAARSAAPRHWLSPASAALPLHLVPIASETEYRAAQQRLIDSDI